VDRSKIAETTRSTDEESPPGHPFHHTAASQSAHNLGRLIVCSRKCAESAICVSGLGRRYRRISDNGAPASNLLDTRKVLCLFASQPSAKPESSSSDVLDVLPERDEGATFGSASVLLFDGGALTQSACSEQHDGDARASKPTKRF
jgi:hypothetical protein